MNRRKNTNITVLAKTKQKDEISPYVMWMLGSLPLAALLVISYQIIISTL